MRSARVMRTWSVVSQKGGSGKTTVLLHLAVAALADGIAVSVIDLDPQRSAEKWSELREAELETDEPIVVHGTAANLDGMLEAARETATELVLIDTPPAVDKAMIFAAAAADVVIVPTRAGLLDRFALVETLDYLGRIAALSKAVVVLNAAGSNKQARADVERVAVKDFGVPMLSVPLEDQPDLSQSLRLGKGVTESAPRRKAARAVQEIYRELVGFERKLARLRKRVTP